MRVISRPPLIEFSRIHPPAAGPLNEWFKKMQQATCKNLNELKQVFNSVDYVGNYRYIFNIGGNNYRLLAAINFRTEIVYIRGVFTHTEYDARNKDGTLTEL